MLKSQTVETYNKNAKAFAEKFDRTLRGSDVDYIFSLCKKINPNVFEIGCGNGRDAKKILTRTDNYLGVDISEGLIKIAKENIPDANFDVADIEDYILPKNLDIVFAFASLIHVPKESFKKIILRVYGSLNDGGIFFISLKFSKRYEEITKEDSLGVRTFWYYSENDIEELRGKFKILKTIRNNINNEEWVDVTLGK